MYNSNKDQTNLSYLFKDLTKNFELHLVAGISLEVATTRVICR